MFGESINLRAAWLQRCGMMWVQQFFGKANLSSCKLALDEAWLEVMRLRFRKKRRGCQRCAGRQHNIFALGSNCSYQVGHDGGSIS